MRLLRPFATPPLPWLLATAMVASWISAMPSLAWQAPALCGSPGTARLADFPAILGPEWSLSASCAAWLFMLLAMMPPLLAQPLREIWRASIAPRRYWAILLFLQGYGLIWLCAGVLLVPTATLLKLLAPGSLAPALISAAAVVWSASPASQAARNRCHRTHRIRAFGRGADWDCLRYGTKLGLSCAANCWPWMLATACMDQAHSAFMGGVTILLFLERVLPPAPAVWQSPPAFQALTAIAIPQKVLGRP